MQPVKTENSNFTFVGPSEADDIEDLPCETAVEIVEGASGERRAHRAVYSVWEPTDEERQAIANGANIKLGVYGVRAVPPCSLETTEEESV